MQDLKYFNSGLNEGLTKVKDRYNLIIYYIILRKLKKETDVKICLEQFYKKVSEAITDQPDLLNQDKRNVMNLFMMAKECADTYWEKESFKVNLPKLDFGTRSQEFAKFGYEFDYFGYKEYSFLTEEEFVIYYIVNTVGLNFRSIGKVLDLSEYNVGRIFANCRVKVDNASKVKES